MRPFHVTADQTPEAEADKTRRKALGNFVVVPRDLKMTTKTAAHASGQKTGKTPSSAQTPTSK